MIKVLSGLITGLLIYRLFPQYALFVGIAAAIILAILIEERHGFLKRLQGKRRSAKKKLPVVKVAKVQSRIKKA